MATKWNILDDYDALNWRSDMLVVNDFGEHVWLKPCYLNSKRIGIIDCCPEDNPCDRHAAMSHKEHKED